MSETYNYSFICYNCKTFKSVQIPRGMPMEAFYETQVKHLICSNCGVEFK